MAIIIGDKNDNFLLGTEESDTIRGKQGDDLIEGFGSTSEGSELGDVIDGGVGNDTASYEHSEEAVSVDLRTGQGSFGDAEGDTLIRIENLIGSDLEAEGDVLRGDNGDNQLQGLAGEDYLFGEKGDDLLDGGQDDDLLVGGGGKDDLKGGKDDDDLIGQNGQDTLEGGEGFDLLLGDGADDVLDGGKDSDVLEGGEQDDLFLFTTVIEGGGNVDTIFDMNFGNDTIGLDVTIFAALTSPAPGPLLASEYQENTDGTAVDADDRIIYDTDGGQLYYDPDGGEGAFGNTQFAQLVGAPDIGFEDFIVLV